MIDEIRTFVGADRKSWIALNLCAALFGVLWDAVNQHLWRPAEAYFLLLALLVADFAAAVWLAGRQGRFETRRAFRVVYKMAAYTALLFFAHNLAKHDAHLSWLPEAVFFPMALILFTSFVKNLSLLGLVPRQAADWLYRNIDVYKNPPKDSPS